MSDVEPLIDAGELIKQLEALRERRDEAASVLVEELNETGGSLIELSSELDVQLADRDYSSVKESLDQIVYAIGNTASEQVEQLARLMSIEIPGGYQGISASSGSARAARQPLKFTELPSPDATGRQADSDQAEDDIADVLGSRVGVCAERIRYLLDYLSNELWPYIVPTAESGDVDKANKAIGDCGDVFEELDKAFKLWSLWLGELCNENPSLAGLAGEQVEVMQQWLADVRSDASTSPGS